MVARVRHRYMGKSHVMYPMDNPRGSRYPGSRQICVLVLIIECISLLTQWGTKIMGDDGRLKKNEAHLNEKATIVFLDQPGGEYTRPNPNLARRTGFTWFDDGTGDVSNSAAAAVDTVAFIEQFRQTIFPPGANFPAVSFLNQDMHIAGESYAGHYIAAIGAEVVRSQPPRRQLLKIKSLAIGNGWFDAEVQQESNYDLVCNDDYRTPSGFRISAESCREWENTITPCLVSISGCRAGTLDCRQVSTGACKTIGADNYWKVELSTSFSPLTLLSTWC